MHYSQLPNEPFKSISFDAGMILSAFNPYCGHVNRKNILFATTGGSQFNSGMTTVDLFEDIDNAKTGTKQGYIITGYDPHLTATVLTFDENNFKMLMANANDDPKEHKGNGCQTECQKFKEAYKDTCCAECSGDCSSCDKCDEKDMKIHHVTLKDGIVYQDDKTNYFDLWVVTNYGTLTKGDSSKVINGYFAIHMKNCLNVTGFQQQTTKDGKVQYSVDFKAFYDSENIDDVPFEIYYSTPEQASEAA